MLHYIISKVGCKPNVGKTVLFKLLYFSDFDYYEKYEEFLSGEAYRKIEHGPAPCHFDDFILKLSNDGLISCQCRDYHNKKQNKYESLAEPSVQYLSARELEEINKVLDKYSELSAKQISGLSHNDMPYEATDDKDIIDYDLVFYRDELTSAREYEDSVENEC
jgi:uncharacterized phage-associated protein